MLVVFSCIDCRYIRPTGGPGLCWWCSRVLSVGIYGLQVDLVYVGSLSGILCRYIRPTGGPGLCWWCSQVFSVGIYGLQVDLVYVGGVLRYSL